MIMKYNFDKNNKLAEAHTNFKWDVDRKELRDVGKAEGFWDGAGSAGTGTWRTGRVDILRQSRNLSGGQLCKPVGEKRHHFDTQKEADLHTNEQSPPFCCPKPTTWQAENADSDTCL